LRDGPRSAHREAAGELEAAVDEALTETRKAVSTLRQGGHTGSLENDIRRIVLEWSEQANVPAALTIVEVPSRLSPQAHAELMRITQEALRNVRRHADATRVEVRVDADADGVVRLTIRDNGRGFHPDQVDGRGFGLRGMAERAESLGGTLTVTSKPQGGTEVAARIPAARRG
jgi:signal transduction histidine kinase